MLPPISSLSHLFIYFFPNHHKYFLWRLLVIIFPEWRMSLCTFKHLHYVIIMQDRACVAACAPPLQRCASQINIKRILFNDLAKVGGQLFLFSPLGMCAFAHREEKT